jgi:hypothetical protein
LFDKLIKFFGFIFTLLCFSLGLHVRLTFLCVFVTGLNIAVNIINYYHSVDKEMVPQIVCVFTQALEALLCCDFLTMFKCLAEKLTCF